jgi:hypothetical protein
MNNLGQKGHPSFISLHFIKTKVGYESGDIIFLAWYMNRENDFANENLYNGKEELCARLLS